MNREFPLLVSFHCGSPFSYITWEMNDRPIGGYSSKTRSLPSNVNNNSAYSNVAMDDPIEGTACEFVCETNIMFVQYEF